MTVHPGAASAAGVRVRSEALSRGRQGPPHWRWRLRATPYLLLAPYVLLTCVFFIYPLLSAAVLAFYQTSGPARRQFVGLENFQFILTDPDLWTALRNTATFAFFSIFLQLPLSLALALLLNARQDRLKGFFRLALFSPHLVGPVFVGILFNVLFMPRYGLFNRVLHALSGWGLEQRWLSDPTLVMPALVITALWMYVGFNMIYFLAALQNVDPALTESARIDGAGAWSVFWNVTLPSIKPVVLFVVVTSTIGSFQLFELPFVLLQNVFGPNNSGLTMVGYLYNHAFENGDLGTGAAVGWLLTLIILAVSLSQVFGTRAAGRDA